MLWTVVARSKMRHSHEVASSARTMTEEELHYFRNGSILLKKAAVATQM